jgi:hypothetical protein
LAIRGFAIEIAESEESRIQARLALLAAIVGIPHGLPVIGPESVESQWVAGSSRRARYPPSCLKGFVFSLAFMRINIHARFSGRSPEYYPMSQLKYSRASRISL